MGQRKNHKIADALSRYPGIDSKEYGEHRHVEEVDAPKNPDEEEEIDTAIDCYRQVNCGVNSMNFIIENFDQGYKHLIEQIKNCLLYTCPSPRDS